MFAKISAQNRYKCPEPLVLPTGSGVHLQELCDGISAPNPGYMKIIRHDGLRFKRHRPVLGTNHQAVYRSVKGALTDAIVRRADSIVIGVYSTLLYNHLQNLNGPVVLRNARDELLRLASQVPSVTFVILKDDEIKTPQGTICSARDLRRLAP